MVFHQKTFRLNKFTSGTPLTDSRSAGDVTAFTLDDEKRSLEARAGTRTGGAYKERHYTFRNAGRAGLGRRFATTAYGASLLTSSSFASAGTGRVVDPPSVTSAMNFWPV